MAIPSTNSIYHACRGLLSRIRSWWEELGGHYMWVYNQVYNQVQTWLPIGTATGLPITKRFWQPTRSQNWIPMDVSMVRKSFFSAPQRHINPREQSTWSSELSDKREEALRKKALVTFVHLENWVNNFRKSSESDKGMHHTNIKNILLVMIQPKTLGPREPNMWMLQDSIDLHQRLKHSHWHTPLLCLPDIELNPQSLSYFRSVSMAQVLARRSNLRPLKERPKLTSLRSISIHWVALVTTTRCICVPDGKIPGVIMLLRISYWKFSFTQEQGNLMDSSPLAIHLPTSCPNESPPLWMVGTQRTKCSCPCKSSAFYM